MTYTVTYRDKSGAKREEVLEAAGRAECFAQCKARGIVPMSVKDGARKVSPKDGGSPCGRNKLRPSRSAVLWRAAILAAILLAILGGVMWWMRGPSHESQAASGNSPAAPQDQPITVVTPQGPVTLRVAEPLPRQAIPGNRQRIEDGRNSIFTNAAERLLARFAEPGRAVAALPDERPTEAEFATCLREPIKVAGTDFTEAVDLKRIVTGMKREMRAYIAGGGTAELYLSELVKRQKLEISYRENAEKRLAELLNGENAKPETRNQKLKTAYEYWLKANASLKSMGIYELPLPDALQGYQASLGLDE